MVTLDLLGKGVVVCTREFDLHLRADILTGRRSESRSSTGGRKGLVYPVSKTRPGSGSTTFRSFLLGVVGGRHVAPQAHTETNYGTVSEDSVM